MATVFQSQLGVGHRVGVIRDQQWFVLNGAILSRLTKNRQSPLLLTALDVTSPVIRRIITAIGINGKDPRLVAAVLLVEGAVIGSVLSYVVQILFQ